MNPRGRPATRVPHSAARWGTSPPPAVGRPPGPADVAGIDPLDVAHTISTQMQEHAHRTIDQADFAVLVRDGADPRVDPQLSRPPDFVVATKADLIGHHADAPLHVSAIGRMARDSGLDARLGEKVTSELARLTAHKLAEARSGSGD